MLHNGSQPLYSSARGTVITNQRSITELWLHKCTHLKGKGRRCVPTFCNYQWRPVRSALWSCQCPQCTVPQEGRLTPYNKHKRAFMWQNKQFKMVQDFQSPCKKEWNKRTIFPVKCVQNTTLLLSELQCLLMDGFPSQRQSFPGRQNRSALIDLIYQS